MTKLLKNKKTVSRSTSKKQEKVLNKNNNNQSGWSKFLIWLQELGKSLQFPIAVLPFAAVLARFGSLGISYTTNSAGEITNQVGYWISFIIQKPGGIVFDNLPLIFAIGVAFGLAKDHRGEVALVGAVFYLIIAAMTMEKSLPEMLYKNVLTFEYDMTIIDPNDATKTISEHVVRSSLFYVQTFKEGVANGSIYILSIGVLGGISAGAISAVLYERFKDIKLPTALSFFGGRRFVPMLGLIVAVPTALLFAIVWPWIQWVLMQFGNLVADPTKPEWAIPGTAIYGALNRLLLAFGLHQILNTFFWFQLPINGPVITPIEGNVIGQPIWRNGDINAFTAGIEGSGLFQSGFFPIMMGGIPAIALAMIYTAKKENRKQVAGFLGGVAIVSLISGITEPIEYSFVFLSPILLVVHALLTGIFMAITTAMQIQVGFGFSAGLIDYSISIAQSWGFAAHNTGVTRVTANPLWILVLTGLAAGVYYPIFYYTINKMNILTPGRGDDLSTPEPKAEKPKESKTKKTTTKTNVAKAEKKPASAVITGQSKYAVMAAKIIAAIGVDNFVSIDNCATRLRLILKDNSKVDDAQIKAAGAFGVKRLGDQAFQIVIGPDVEHVANEVKTQLAKLCSPDSVKMN